MSYMILDWIIWFRKIIYQRHFEEIDFLFWEGGDLNIERALDIRELLLDGAVVM